MIYDRNFKPLVGKRWRQWQRCPGEESAALAGKLSGEEREAFTQNWPSGCRFNPAPR